MKRLGMIAFILALVLCFAMPASAVKIAPYNMPLHDIVTWDRFDEEFRVANPENEAITVAWPEDVDLWNYDGDFWKYDLPDGDEFLFIIGVNVGEDDNIITYTYGEPIFEVWGTCAGTDGAVNAMPMYVMSILTGEGQVGRAAEFVLAPTCVRMGAWGNAIKAKLDLSGDGVLGSIGLLAGVCAEVVTPAGALNGTVACVEHEIVATEGYLAGDHIGSANTLNFMQFALGGNAAAVTEVDNHGQFMIMNGLTQLAGNMLSLDYVTLKCAVNDLRKYLVLSTEENMLEFTTTLTDSNSQVTTGHMSIDVRLDVGGDSTGNIVGNSMMVWLTDGGTLNPGGSLIYPLEVGIDESGASTTDTTDAHVIFGLNMNGLISDNAYNRFCPFRINTSNRAITALFDMVAAPSMGITGGAGEGTPAHYVPLYVAAGGGIGYVRIYSATD